MGFIYMTSVRIEALLFTQISQLLTHPGVRCLSYATFLSKKKKKTRKKYPLNSEVDRARLMFRSLLLYPILSWDSK